MNYVEDKAMAHSECVANRRRGSKKSHIQLCGHSARIHQTEPALAKRRQPYRAPFAKKKTQPKERKKLLVSEERNFDLSVDKSRSAAGSSAIDTSIAIIIGTGVGRATSAIDSGCAGIHHYMRALSHVRGRRDMPREDLNRWSVCVNRAKKPAWHWYDTGKSTVDFFFALCLL